MQSQRLGYMTYNREHKEEETKKQSSVEVWVFFRFFSFAGGQTHCLANSCPITSLLVAEVRDEVQWYWCSLPAVQPQDQNAFLNTDYPFREIPASTIPRVLISFTNSDHTRPCPTEQLFFSELLRKHKDIGLDEVSEQKVQSLLSQMVS